MDQEKYYTINVLSKEPSEVEIGQLNADTGLPKGKTQKTKLALGGISIPNFSRVWGRLERHKTSGALTGKVEYMKWEEEGGTLIELRYMKASSSLSKEYQETILKLKPREEEGEIFLNIGINEFKTSEDRLLIELLKNHYMNADCKSRNPNTRVNVFEQYDGAARVKKRLTSITARREAEEYILAASNDVDGFAVLATIFGIDLHQEDDIIQEQLLERVEEDVEAFLALINEAKGKAKSILDEAVIADVLKGADGEEVMVRGAKGKLMPLFKDEVTIQSGEKVSNFLMESFMDHKTYDAILSIEAALSKQLQTELD